MADEAPALTLDQHLAQAYDYFVHATRKGWAPAIFAAAIDADIGLKASALARMAELRELIRVRGEGACFASTIHLRALDQTLGLVNAPPSG